MNKKLTNKLKIQKLKQTNETETNQFHFQIVNSWLETLLKNHFAFYFILCPHSMLNTIGCSAMQSPTKQQQCCEVNSSFSPLFLFFSTNFELSNIDQHIDKILQIQYRMKRILFRFVHQRNPILIEAPFF